MKTAGPALIQMSVMGRNASGLEIIAMLRM